MNTLKRRANLHRIQHWPYKVDHEEAREVLVTWAERNEVQASRAKHACLHWLAGHQCPEAVRDHSLRRVEIPCPTLGMFDHRLAWIREGRPAVITAANYSPATKLYDQIGSHAANLGLTLDCDQPGWYGRGTTHIEVWTQPGP